MERFWSKVDKRGADECWSWTAAHTHRGYGYFFFESKLHHAHRVSFRMHHGRWPEPACLHSCDNRGCVNPAHLREGTNADNSADMVARRRGTHGERMWSAKLTEQDVRDIRANYVLCRVTHKELAERFGVTRTVITNAINGVTWGHL